MPSPLAQRLEDDLNSSRQNDRFCDRCADFDATDNFRRLPSEREIERSMGTVADVRANTACPLCRVVCKMLDGPYDWGRGIDPTVTERTPLKICYGTDYLRQRVQFVRGEDNSRSNVGRLWAVRRNMRLRGAKVADGEIVREWLRDRETGHQFCSRGKVRDGQA